MREYELVIIGGGPAGLAAAVAAHRAGITDILILERDNELGGILSLVCCSPWGHKESNTTEQLN